MAEDGVEATKLVRDWSPAQRDQKYPILVRGGSELEKARAKQEPQATVIGLSSVVDLFATKSDVVIRLELPGRLLKISVSCLRLCGRSRQAKRSAPVSLRFDPLRHATSQGLFRWCPCSTPGSAEIPSRMLKVT